MYTTVLAHPLHDSPTNLCMYKKRKGIRLYTCNPWSMPDSSYNPRVKVRIIRRRKQSPFRCSAFPNALNSLLLLLLLILLLFSISSCSLRRLVAPPDESRQRSGQPKN